MGTTAFVGYRFKGKVQGFELSADGMYENTGLEVLKKYKELSKTELIHFFENQVKFVEGDPELDDENLLDAPYRIWNLDWKNDSVEIEQAGPYYTKHLTREYGYVFNLDEDLVEVYEQAENEEELNEQTYIVTRENLEEIEQAFRPKEREDHGLSDEEVLALRRQRWTK